MEHRALKEDEPGYFSQGLAQDFQSTLQKQFGESVSLAEAQQIGLRIAQFVLIKEIRKCEKKIK